MAIMQIDLNSMHTKKITTKKEKKKKILRRRASCHGVQGEQCNLSNNFPQHLILCNFSLLSTINQQPAASAIQEVKKELQAHENVREGKVE